MVLRYAHLGSEHLAEHAEKISALRGVARNIEAVSFIPTPEKMTKKTG